MRCGVDFIDETLSQAEGMRGKDKCKWNEKGCFWIYEILWETPHWMSYQCFWAVTSVNDAD